MAGQAIIHSVKVVNDSLRFALTHPLVLPPAAVTVNVPQPHEPWGGAFVQTLIGGAAAILGGLGAPWVAGLLEKQRRRAEVVRRVRLAFEQVIAIAKSSVKKDRTHAINPEMMRGMVVEWDRFDRVSDDLALLIDAKLVDDIETVLGWARIVAEKVLGDEEGFRRTVRETGQPTTEGFEVSDEIKEGIHNHRDKLLGLLGQVVTKGEGVLARVNAKWRPPAGHKPQEEVAD